MSGTGNISAGSGTEMPHCLVERSNRCRFRHSMSWNRNCYVSLSGHDAWHPIAIRSEWGLNSQRAIAYGLGNNGRQYLVLRC